MCAECVCLVLLLSCNGSSREFAFFLVANDLIPHAQPMMMGFMCCLVPLLLLLFSSYGGANSIGFLESEVFTNSNLSRFEALEPQSGRKLVRGMEISRGNLSFTLARKVSLSASTTLETNVQSSLVWTLQFFDLFKREQALLPAPLERSSTALLQLQLPWPRLPLLFPFSSGDSEEDIEASEASSQSSFNNRQYSFKKKIGRGACGEVR